MTRGLNLRINRQKAAPPKKSSMKLLRVGFTFDAADPPQPGVRQVAFDFPALHLALVRGGVGGVADVSPRVEPVVGADGDGHEAEGGEGPHDGQQSLHPSVTPCHGVSYRVRMRRSCSFTRRARRAGDPWW